MQSLRKLLPAVITTVAVSAWQPALADDKPPPGAMALSTVLTQLEQKGYTPITDVNLDNGHWEVEAYKGAEKRELLVDPNSGEILSDKPDDD